MTTSGDVYLCWWPSENETEKDAHEVPMMTELGLYRSPEDAALIAAEECGGGLGDHQRICVMLRGGIEVHQFDAERVDMPQYVVTEVV